MELHEQYFIEGTFLSGIVKRYLFIGDFTVTLDTHYLTQELSSVQLRDIAKDALALADKLDELNGRKSS